MTWPSHVPVVRAEVYEDVEAEWNRWYDAVHLPEILACPGFRAGRRYRAGDSAAGRASTRQPRCSQPGPSFVHGTQAMIFWRNQQ